AELVFGEDGDEARLRGGVPPEHALAVDIDGAITRLHHEVGAVGMMAFQMPRSVVSKPSFSAPPVTQLAMSHPFSGMTVMPTRLKLQRTFSQSRPVPLRATVPRSQNAKFTPRASRSSRCTRRSCCTVGSLRY